MSRDTVWLLAITAAFVLIQLIFLPPFRRYLNYDEAIYLSQVDPAVRSLDFTAPRARGLPWLLAPIAMFSGPVAVVRLYVLFVSSALFFVAFHAWLPTLRRRALIAAAVFGTSWLALYYGTEIYPNLPVALGAVAASGYLAQHLVAHDPNGRHAWLPLGLAACALVFIALIRPTDATFIALALGLAAVTSHLRVLVIRWAALGAALIAGWIPWIVEAYLNFGGLRARFAAASENVGSGEADPIRIALGHLALTDGPLQGKAPRNIDLPDIPVGIMWWVVLATAVLMVVVRGLAGRRKAMLIPAFAATASAVQYLVLTSIVTARFLIPVYALAVVCVAAVLPTSRHWAAKVIGIVLLAAWIIWNVPIAAEVNAEYVKRGQVRLTLGQILKERAQGRECQFASESNFPQIAFASGCQGARFAADHETIRLHHDPGSAPVYVLATSDPEDSRVLSGPGELVPLDDQGAPGWWLFVPEDRSIFRW